MKSQNILFAERWFREVWNEKNESSVYDMLEEHAKLHGLTDGADGEGWTHFLPFYYSFLEAFPDVHIELLDVFDNEDRVAMRMLGHATHLGTFAGIEATGNPVTIEAMIICRIRNGKIYEAWNEVNLAKLFKQISA